ncbi:MAG: hypothetical protein JXQ90_08095 [Cyclobacteriaceae bacterium]
MRIPFSHKHIFFTKHLHGQALTAAKLRDFKLVVIVQLFMMFTALLVPDILNYIIPSVAVVTSEMIFNIGMGLYVYSLWNMLRIYSKSEELVMFLFMVIIGIFVLSVIVINPFFTIIEGVKFQIFSTFIMVALISVESFAIYFMIREIIAKDIPISEKLWGAACIYFIIGITFGGVFEILCIWDISHLPIDVPLRVLHFMRSIDYSFLVLSGLDNPYVNISAIVRRLSTIESIWGNLFIVFVVGRMLYK